MNKVDCKQNEVFSKNSKPISIIPNSKYSISAQFSGLSGEPYCAYLGVVILDNSEKEIARPIKWLNNFSKIQNEIKIIFTSPPEAKSATIIYRINIETPFKGNCQFNLIEIDDVKIKQLSTDVVDNFNSVNDYVFPRKKELTPEQEDQLEQNLVWIFASPRSGTQWIGTQLLEYGTVLSRGPSIGLNLGATHGGFELKSVRLIDFRGSEPDYFYSKASSEIWTYYLRKLILNRLYSQFQNISKPIIIPDPEGSMGADILQKSLPKSKIIFLIRDGRDVVDSVIDAEKPGSWYIKSRKIAPLTEENRKKRIEQAIRRWMKIIEICMTTFENHPEHLRLKIKYEDLRQNTLEELGKIYKFIGINIPRNELENIVKKYSFENISKDKKGTGKVTRSASPGKWHENFNEEEQEKMNEIMSETLKRLGYL